MKARIPRESLQAFWLLSILFSISIVLFKPLWSLFFPELIPEYIFTDLPPLQGPSLSHWLGTDEVGRDLLVRLIFGMGYSCLFGATVALGTLILGTGLGLLFCILPFNFQYFSVLFQECLGALPFLPLAFILLSFFPGNILLIAGLKVLLSWPMVSHLVFQEARLMRMSPLIQSATSQGLSRTRIALRFFTPQFLPLLKGLFETLFISAILSLSTLDFFGLGFPIPTPTLPEGFRQFLEHSEAWWLFVFPLFFLIFVLGGLRLFRQVDQEL